MVCHENIPVNCLSKYCRSSFAIYCADAFVPVFVEHFQDQAVLQEYYGVCARVCVHACMRACVRVCVYVDTVYVEIFTVDLISLFSRVVGHPRN